MLSILKAHGAAYANSMANLGNANWLKEISIPIMDVATPGKKNK